MSDSGKKGHETAKQGAKALSLGDLRKAEPHPGLVRGSFKPDETLEAIFKVRSKEHVPAKVNPRASIDSTMFTGTFLARDLDAIEADPLVESIAVSKTLRVVD